ncbi:MAG: hypothetical protein JW982_16025 [Spirochaetes bacterium]|nr:hypothetical protein [Spirochaetota bacterium]
MLNASKTSDENFTYSNDNFSGEEPAIASDNASLAAELSGTCFKGLCCSSPSCSRWSDIDANEKCDRGV